MNKLKQLFKRNAYFTITLIVLLLSISFAGVTLAVFSIGNTVDQTSIGFIYLGNYKEDQYANILNQEIGLWKANAEYKIQYQDYTYPIDLDLVEFNLEQTLLHITRDQENIAYFNLPDENLLVLKNQIDDHFTLAITSDLDIDSFIEEFMLDIGDLKNRKVYELSDYLNNAIAITVLDQTEVSNINSSDVTAIISQVTDLTINANERFSILDQIGQLNLSNEQLSIIASGIQGIVLNTNFSGYIFEQNYTLPAWASSGQNVRILRINDFDLSFFNGFDFDYHILIEKVNDTTLSFTLTGYPLITTYETTAVFQVEIPFQTIYIDNPDIDEFTPGVIITETDDEYIYHLLIQDGVVGQVTFYLRTVTRLGASSEVSRLFDEQTLPINAFYYENIVEKGGI
ncbi:MAG: hypothetical protein ABII85_02675 [Bacillota bacterium]